VPKPNWGFGILPLTIFRWFVFEDLIVAIWLLLLQISKLSFGSLLSSD
jgi:hypothetical protein